MNDNNILAVILAGGKSKRFGEDKNLAKLGSKSLLEHVIKRHYPNIQNSKYKAIDLLKVVM